MSRTQIIDEIDVALGDATQEELEAQGQLNFESINQLNFTEDKCQSTNYTERVKSCINLHAKKQLLVEPQ